MLECKIKMNKIKIQINHSLISMHVGTMHLDVLYRGLDILIYISEMDSR